MCHCNFNFDYHVLLCNLIYKASVSLHHSSSSKTYTLNTDLHKRMSTSLPLLTNIPITYIHPLDLYTSSISNMSKFRRIGAGFCGSVWAPQGNDDPSFALKREDGGPGRSLSNDFEMHKRVLQGLVRLASLDSRDAQEPFPLHINIPQCQMLIEPGNDWWDRNLSRFPAGCSPCKSLLSERIPPFPQKTREFLVDRFCPQALTEAIKASGVNRDCLIRPYLGRRKVVPGTGNLDRPSKLRVFSLRNHPLYLDQMEQLHLDEDAKVYAKIMAEALAMMHWLAEVDANDVEFVLAPSRVDNHYKPRLENSLGKHVVWLLDFDYCNPMTMDLEGIEKAVAAFFRNDPYYPRPGTPFWELFKQAYLQASSRMTDCKDKHKVRLSHIFIERIEAHAKRA